MELPPRTIELFVLMGNKTYHFTEILADNASDRTVLTSRHWLRLIPDLGCAVDNTFHEVSDAFFVEKFHLRHGVVVAYSR